MAAEFQQFYSASRLGAKDDWHVFEAPPDISPNNAFTRIRLTDIKGTELVLAAKKWGVPAQRCTISLDTDGRFVAFSEGGELGTVGRKDFQVLLRQGGDNEVKLRDFVQGIELNKEWQQALLQSHTHNEPVDAEVFGSSYLPPLLAPASNLARKPKPVKRPHNLLVGAPTKANVSKSAETASDDLDMQQPGSSSRKARRISSRTGGAAAGGLAAFGGGISSSMRTTRKVPLSAEPVADPGAADSPALERPAPSQLLQRCAAAAAAALAAKATGGSAEASPFASGSEQTPQQPFGAAASGALPAQQQLQVPAAVLGTAEQQQQQEEDMFAHVHPFGFPIERSPQRGYVCLSNL